MSELTALRLINQPTNADVATLDTHPLVRAHFGRVLSEESPSAWRSAHNRIFVYLARISDELPATLDQMEYVFQAVIHGCKAGRQTDSLRELYIPRIMRGEELYSAHTLGAVGPILTCLSHFFEPGGWSQVVKPGPRQQGLNESDELTVLTHVGMYLSTTKGYAATEVKNVYRRAHRLCFQAGDSPQLFLVLFGLWRFYMLRGELMQCTRLHGDLDRLAGSVGRAGFRVAAHRALATVSYSSGEFRQACDLATAGLAIGRSVEEARDDARDFLYSPMVSCFNYCAMAKWQMGYPEEALEESKKAVELSHELGHAHKLAVALCFNAFVHQFLDQPEKTQEVAEEVIELCSEHGLKSGCQERRFWPGGAKPGGDSRQKESWR